MLGGAGTRPQRRIIQVTDHLGSCHEQKKKKIFFLPNTCVLYIGAQWSKHPVIRVTHSRDATRFFFSMCRPQAGPLGKKLGAPKSEFFEISFDSMDTFSVSYGSKAVFLDDG